MKNKARKYKPSTVRRLDTLSGNQCSNPNCTRKLIARDGETIISKICHIEAASPDGPRYNPHMTDDERRHYENLILLCDECHSIIDNKEKEDQYPVELLKKWKRNHENFIRQNLLIRKPQLLNQAINAIANLDFEETGLDEDEIKSFNIHKKIKHNSLKINRSLIEEYSSYYGKINLLYGELENQGSFKKEKLLRNIKLLYIKIKGEYVKDKNNKLEIIQNNSDKIFKDIEDKLIEIIDSELSNNEDIMFALPIILVDAFMRCKILERPPK